MSTTPTPGSSGPSRSEKGIGARLSKAKDIITLLGTFTPAYAPAQADLATAAIDTLHTAADTKHRAAVAAKQAEKTAQAERKKLFGNAGRGVQGRLSDIGKAVKAAYNTSSPQYKAADKLIDQMRGDVPADTGGEGVSQSQTSFAAITQAYSDLIDLVTSYGADYAPVKDDIKPAGLATHLTAIKTANANVVGKSLAARDAENKRDIDLSMLSDRLQRAKAAVSSQYDYGSPQEKALRKLNV